MIHDETGPGWDWPLAISVVVLALLGLLMIQSASADVALRDYGTPLHFLMRQSMGLGVGLLGACAVLIAPYGWIRRWAWPFYLVALVLLLLVLTPLGHSVKGATRWLSLGVVHVQPSEIAKLALVLVLADYLANNRGRLKDVVGVGLPGVGLLLPMVVLMIYQKDFGTTVILLGLSCALFIVAGLAWRYVGIGLGAAAALLGLMIAIEPYRVQRLVSFLAPFEHQQGSGYQVVQGWIALATGGATGTGLAQGVAQRGFLPEPHTDFIAAIIGEELGALGLAVAVGLLLTVVWRAFHIAIRAPDLFGMLTAGGIGAMLGAQAIINIGVVGGLLPAKGLVLPFLSYGASAAVVHVVSVGVLLKVGIATSERETRLPSSVATEGVG